MRDQAAELRSLMFRAARRTTPLPGPPTHLIALCGGKGGVGVTSLAVNLAASLAEYGMRTVLVDANLYRADAAAYCGLAEAESIADVLSGGRDIHEVLQPGPSGLQVAPGIWAPDALGAIEERAAQRLVTQLKQMGRHAETVVVDLGSGLTELTRRFWSAADTSVVVTTPDSVSLMDSYATIKTLSDGPGDPAIGMIVNRSADDEAAGDVFARAARSCQRFLNLPLINFGHAPLDPQMQRSIEQQSPLVISHPKSAAAAHIHRIASRLSHRPAHGAAA